MFQDPNKTVVFCVLQCLTHAASETDASETIYKRVILTCFINLYKCFISPGG